jgi:hypothetical protein
VRANVTMRWGSNVIGRAKCSQVTYSQVRTDARRWGLRWS